MLSHAEKNLESSSSVKWWGTLCVPPPHSMRGATASVSPLDLAHSANCRAASVLMNAEEAVSVGLTSHHPSRISCVRRRACGSAAAQWRSK
jgi:hypothetical protein